MVSEPLTFTSFFEYFTANGIFRFRIPMLFVISGYLFALGDTQPFVHRIKSRARTLLLPYVLWSAFGLLLTWALEQNTTTTAFVRAANLSQPIANYPWQEWLFRWLIYPVPFQLWFIRVLFFYNAAYPLMLGAITNAPKIWFAVVVFLWIAPPGGMIILESEGLFFFSLGVWLQKTQWNIEERPQWLNIKLVAAAWILVAAAKTILAFQPNLGGWSFPALLLMFRFVEFSGLLVAWFGMNWLVRWCMARQWFVWSSGFSFMIYALHVPLVNYLLDPAFQQWSGLPMFRLMLYFALPLALVGLSIGVGAVLRRVVPPVYGVLTGGRGMR
jgi:fucose 4-O-acetylase-like acetyltransferase